MKCNTLLIETRVDWRERTFSRDAQKLATFPATSCTFLTQTQVTTSNIQGRGSSWSWELRNL